VRDIFGGVSKDYQRAEGERRSGATCLERLCDIMESSALSRRRKRPATGSLILAFKDTAWVKIPHPPN
jgi:hypothetical protein